MLKTTALIDNKCNLNMRTECAKKAKMCVHNYTIVVNILYCTR